MIDFSTLRERLFLTVPEAATILRADPRTVRRAIEAGDITAVRINGVVRIPTQRFLDEVHLTETPCTDARSPAPFVEIVPLDGRRAAPFDPPAA